MEAFGDKESPVKNPCSVVIAELFQNIQGIANSKRKFQNY